MAELGGYVVVTGYYNRSRIANWGRIRRIVSRDWIDNRSRIASKGIIRRFW